jgi:hypothetical protein
MSLFAGSNAWSARMGYSVGRSGVEPAATLCHVVDGLCPNMAVFVNVHTPVGIAHICLLVILGVFCHFGSRSMLCGSFKCTSGGVELAAIPVHT